MKPDSLIRLTSRVSLAASLLVMTTVALGQKSVEPNEISVPFPKVSPRPNASAIYCTPALDNLISATDSHISSVSSVQVTVKIRLIFSGPDVLLSVAETNSENREEYRTLNRYTGSVPGPNDFAGNVYTSDDGNGNATVLAVNRDTGTFIWSRFSAGRGGTSSYPEAITAFYVCGQRNP